MSMQVLSLLKSPWATVALLPLWASWSITAIAQLEARQVEEAMGAADGALARVQHIVNAATPGAPLVLHVQGHRCGCASAAQQQDWDASVRRLPGRHLDVSLPGERFSVLVFDAGHRLRFAGAAGAGSCGRPDGLLEAALRTQGAQPISQPCNC